MTMYIETSKGLFTQNRRYTAEILPIRRKTLSNQFTQIVISIFYNTQ